MVESSALGTDDLRRHAAGMLAVSIALGAFLGIIGPFGSYLSLGLPLRILHFVIVALINAVLITATLGLVSRVLFRGAVPTWIGILVVIPLSLPTTAIVRYSLQVLAPQTLAYVSFGELFVQTLFLNLLVNGVAAVWRAKTAAKRSGPALATPPAGEARDGNVQDVLDVVETRSAEVSVQALPLRDRLPPGLKSAAILSLTAEDHYLRVRTERGDALILMAIGGAQAALDGLGIRIHRSHWAALAAIRGLERVEGRDFVRVGSELLPVARNRRREVADVANQLQTAAE